MPLDPHRLAVLLGDAVLDRGVRNANGRTKLALQGKPGLGASHVFGTRVDELTRDVLRVEPSKVHRAADRMADLPDFAERAAIRDDLVRRASAQEELFAARDRGGIERARLVSAGVRLVTEAADAPARTRGALDARFPRQRDYVATFFLDVAARRSRAKSTEPAPSAA